eukprot:1332187-Amorphochlora_amoeboformis.AAC.1
MSDPTPTAMKETLPGPKVPPPSKPKPPPSNDPSKESSSPPKKPGPQPSKEPSAGLPAARMHASDFISVFPCPAAYLHTGAAILYEDATVSCERPRRSQRIF